MDIRGLLIFIIVCSFSDAYKRGQQVEPPEPINNFGYTSSEENAKEIARNVAAWKPSDGTNPWELSGLLEGDIVPDEKYSSRNGFIDNKYRWKYGIVPIYIQEEEFSDKHIEKIMEAIKEFYHKTCIRFRPFQSTDTFSYVHVRSIRLGCWSSVGRQFGGQILNLQRPGCDHTGVVIHEFLHALGFTHQHNASDRDNYVQIHWDNIVEGKENNFKKYNESTVTSFGESYDYGSIMHYSAGAFSKNGNATIEPLADDVKIGQNLRLSEKDITKLQAMYKTECENRDKIIESESFYTF